MYEVYKDLQLYLVVKIFRFMIQLDTKSNFVIFTLKKLNNIFSPLLFSPGSEEGGVPPRAIRPLQPDGPLPGTSERL